ncbi:hypothetical protein [Methylobacterium oryzisoli]|uniref:hypothetical protein n=1 Tax=Methylobacterium oryzisoli TaxID=3385502 RepID=UPI003892A340
MIQVFHDADRGAIFVSTQRVAYPSRTLMALRSGDIIAVRLAYGDRNVVEAHWAEFARRDGSAFTSADEAYAYVADECNRAPARMPTVMVAAAEPIAAGMPLAISRLDGRLLPARADTYVRAFVVGLAAEGAETGFPARAVRTYVTLPDWTAVAGTADLTPSVPYFLAPEGGVTVTPSLEAGHCVVRVGEASSPRTLMFHPADPILV